MGFFDSLLKREASKIISGIVDNAVDDMLNRSGKSKDTFSGAPETNPDEENCFYDEAVVRERIEKVVAAEWSGYELRKNIPATEMFGSDEARSYTYGLYLNNIPKAMIIILDNGEYRKKSVRLAHEACRNQGVFCMNLMLQLPNRRSYISEQLSNNVTK